IVIRTILRSADFPETVPFFMSCSPYGYDPRNLPTHGEYAGEFPTFDEADSYNSWFARSVAQTRPLH
ncbi:MAG: hypothetical protein Q8M19_14720, partial [Reyranella sp.]|nr:hypothetical protein [Reyranella sp.]